MKTAILLSTILSVFLCEYTFAQQAGTLDSTFNNNGIQTTLVDTSAFAESVAMQSDGKIVVAGNSYNGVNNKIAIIRYNNDGTLDNTFGTNGVVTTLIGQNAGGGSIAIQSDGKIVVVGDSYNMVNNEIAIVRYNNDGTLDSTFGTNGVVTTLVGQSAEGMSFAIQSDGKIVVTGISNNGTANEFVVIRYNSNGTLDSSFGTNGVTTTKVGDDDNSEAILIQPDGKIIVAGYTDADSSLNSNYDNVLIRYNSNGTLDNSFGTGGIVVSDLGAEEFTFAAILQTDGKIIVTGYGITADKIMVQRYNTDGAVDNTFSQVTTIGTDASGHAVVIQPDGKVVVGASAYNGTNYVVALVRYNTDASLDNSFGTGGIQTTPIGTGDGYVASAALQSDGKIVVAGESDNGTNSSFAVVRYHGNISTGILSFTEPMLVNAYPNPNYGTFKIQVDKIQQAEVKIYNVVGEVIYSSLFKNSQSEIDLSEQPSGIYFLQIKTNKEIASQKIILNK